MIERIYIEYTEKCNHISARGTIMEDNVIIALIQYGVNHNVEERLYRYTAQRLKSLGCKNLFL